MKDIPHFALVLTIVAAISAGSLAWLNKITKPRIIAMQKAELEAGIKNVLPGSDNGAIEEVMDADGAVSYYKGYRDQEKSQLIGYAALIAPQGYSSNIRTIIGIDSSGTNVLSIKVLSQKETPGLGTKCCEIKYGDDTPWWTEQFVNRNMNDLAVDKDGGPIQSIPVQLLPPGLSLMVLLTDFVYCRKNCITN